MDAPHLPAESGQQPHPNPAPKVRITVRVEGSAHRLTRAGRVDKVARDFSLEALMRQAVNPSLLRVMRELVPAQFESEEPAVEEIANALGKGYHLRINDADQLFAPSAWAQQKAENHLAPQSEAESDTDFVLNLTLVPSAYAQIQSRPQPAATQADSDAAEQQTPAPAEPKPRVPKIEQLKERLRNPIAALNFEGLFCGNPEIQSRKEKDEQEPSVALLDTRLISEYFINANALRRRGEFERALSYYTVLVKCEEQNPVYWYLLGKTLLDLGRSQDADSALRRAESLGHDAAARELGNLPPPDPSAPTST